MREKKSVAAVNPPSWAWNGLLYGVLFLPFSSIFSVAILLVTLLSLWKQQYRRLIRYPFNWGLGILSLWLIISSCFAFNPIDAFLGLPNFLPGFAVLAAFTVLLQKPSQLRQLAWAIVLPSLLVVILGLGQLFGGWETPSFLNAIFQIESHGNPEGRMSSTFMYANLLAAYLLIAFILGLGLWIECYQAWQQKGKQPLKWRFGLLTLTVFADGMGLILTDSRNAWGLACLACLAFALYLGWRWLVLGIATVAGSVLWAAWGPFGREGIRQIVPAYFWVRLTDELYSDRAVGTLRSTQWQFAWEMMVQHPWLGWGLRNFTPLYQEKMHEFLGHPHNLYLMLLGETGIPATLLLCGLVGWVIVQAIRLVRIWSTSSGQKLTPEKQKNSWILLTYLLAFASLTLFNGLDVTIFDIRVNLLGWILLSSISGIVYRYRFRLAIGE